MNLANFNRLGDTWGAETSPAGTEGAYLNAMNDAAPGIVELAQQAATTGESLIQAIARIRTAVQMTDSQRNALNAQLSRYGQGLPPVTRNASTVSPLLWIGAGLLLFMLLSGKRGAA